MDSFGQLGTSLGLLLFVSLLFARLVGFSTDKILTWLVRLCQSMVQFVFFLIVQAIAMVISGRRQRMRFMGRPGLARESDHNNQRRDRY